MTRALHQAARRFADGQSDRLAAVPTARLILATVANVIPGNSEDGNATVTVTWRGEDIDVSSYGSTYTPAVGHRVLCAYVDSQLIVIDRQIGFPLES